MDYLNEYRHLFSRTVCWELAFSSLMSAAKGPSQIELHRKWGGRKYWEDFPLCPPLVFGSSPAPVSLLPLGISDDIFCHCHFMSTYYPMWALFSPLAGVLLPGTAAGLPNTIPLCSWSSCFCDGGWKCSCEGSHSLTCAGLPRQSPAAH